MDYTCPHCKRVNEYHDGPTPDATPAPGDVSLCWRCGGLSVYTEHGLREPTTDERLELYADQDVIAAQQAIRETLTPSEAVERWRG